MDLFVSNVDSDGNQESPDVDQLAEDAALWGQWGWNITVVI